MSALRSTLAVWCRHHRVIQRLTQDALAERAGITRGYIAAIEMGRANPTLDVVASVAGALDLEIEWRLRPPIVHADADVRDLAHARCSAYVDRRLRRAGLETKREVEIVHARSHGWIDLLAFDPTRATLIIVEVKTRIDDIGAIERQVSWYERSSREVARRVGWRPARIVTWLAVLATAEADAVIHANRPVFDVAFPGRSVDVLSWLAGERPGLPGRSLVLVDPLSRRRDWLIRTRIDGRRSELPYGSVRDLYVRLSSP